MESTFWSSDAHVTRLSASKEPSAEAFILFHGFPGEPPLSEQEKYRDRPRRAVDVGQAVFAATGADMYLPHYEGLGGSRGRFSFTGSVERSLEVAREVAAKHRKVHILGNSWGGLVGFNAHRALGSQAGSLVLISPVTDLHSDEVIKGILPRFLKNYPHILGDDSGAFDRAFADMREVRRRFNPLTAAEQDRQGAPDAKVFLIHGRQDATVPVESSRRFHASFPAHYVELDADHTYSENRQAMIDSVLGFVSQVLV